MAAARSHPRSKRAASTHSPRRPTREATESERGTARATDERQLKATNTPISASTYAHALLPRVDCSTATVSTRLTFTSAHDDRPTPAAHAQPERDTHLSPPECTARGSRFSSLLTGSSPSSWSCLFLGFSWFLLLVVDRSGAALGSLFPLPVGVAYSRRPTLRPYFGPENWYVARDVPTGVPHLPVRRR